MKPKKIWQWLISVNVWLVFILLAAPVFAAAPLLEEGFENTTFPPSGWGRTVLQGSANWARTTGDKHTGAASALYQSGTSGHQARLYTPVFDLSQSGEPEVHFWMKRWITATCPENLQVEISLDGGSTYTDIPGAQFDVCGAPATGWYAQTVSLATYASATSVSLGFKATGGTWQGVHIDDLGIPGPPAPEYVHSGKGVTPQALSSDATLTYTIVISNSGNAAGHPTVIDPLPAGVTYVEGSATGGAIYNAGLEQIEWSEALDSGAGAEFAFRVTATVTEGCILNTAVISDVLLAAPEEVEIEVCYLPTSLNEDFENGGVIPVRWVNEPDNQRNWEFLKTSGSSGGPIFADHTSGSGYFAYFNSYITEAGAVGRLTSPWIDISGYTFPTLGFYWHRPYSGHTARLEVNIYSGGVWYMDVLPGLNTQTSDWTLQELNLSGLASPLRVQFQVRGDSLRNFGLDDVAIYEGNWPVFATSFKTVTPALGLPTDEPLTYAIVIHNTGALDGVATLSDTIPAGLSYVVDSVAAQGGALPTYAAGRIAWTGPVTAGARVTITFQAAVEITEGCVVNHATLSAPLFALPLALAPVESCFLPTTLPNEAFGETFPPPAWASTPLTGTADWAPEVVYHSAGYAAALSGAAPGDAARLALPPLDLTHSASPYLRFWMRHSTAGATAVQVQVSTDGGATYTNVTAPFVVGDGAPEPTWILHTVDLSAYRHPGARVAFLGVYDSGVAYLDDVNVLDAGVTPNYIYLDGQLNDWYPEAELLETDARSAVTVSLYTTWDAQAIYFGLEGVTDWTTEGDLWLYFDTTDHVGAASAVGGAHTFPVSAPGGGMDYALVVTDTETYTLFAWDGAAWSVTPFSGAVAGVGDSLEIALPRSDVGLSAAGRLAFLAFIEAEGTEVGWASFPTANPLGTAFIAAYHWRTTGAGALPNASFTLAAEVNIFLPLVIRQ